MAVYRGLLGLLCWCVWIVGCGEQEFTEVDGCELRPGANCTRADLRGVELAGLDLRDINLAGADLRGITLTDVDLSGANMRNTLLEGARWSRTICPDGSRSQDNGATCGGHLQNHVSACQTAPGVDCSGRVLSNEDLRYSNLRNAVLVEASLDGVDLTGADLSGANLTCADLSSARVEAVDWNGARCPDGELSDQSGGSCESFTDPETAAFVLFFSCSSEGE